MLDVFYCRAYTYVHIQFSIERTLFCVKRPRTDTEGGCSPPPASALFLSIILCIIGAEQVVMCAASAGFIFVENGYYGHFGV